MKISDKFIKATDRVCDFDEFVNAPYLRKGFTLDFMPEKAEITICGLGFYELYVNGEEITKGHLAPYISNPDDICCYDNYDITKLLKKGDNAIGIILGNGMRNAYGGFIWDFDKADFRGPVTLALCFKADGEGKSLTFEADESFKTHPSPILYDDLRMGYCYDAKLEIPDWNKAGFDDSAWDNALPCDTPKGIKKLCAADPIVVTHQLRAADIKKYDSLPFAYVDKSPDAAPLENCVRENVYVFDFGVNTAGVTRLKVNGKPGQKIVVRHGEHLQGGRFSIGTTIFGERDEDTVTKYTKYAQTDVFICKGGEEVFVPKFKYDGFRYAYVEGLLDYQVNEETLVYLVMNSQLAERATFVCSDEVINKLWENCRRSDLANFYYFPTDCPHREKNGWTGDASMSAEHMLLNLTAEASLREWLCNISTAQTEAGVLPGIVPTGGWGFTGSNGPAWDSVCVNLPYYIYKFTGDISAFKEAASTILRYLDYVMTRRDERGLIAFGLGDWVDPFQHSRPDDSIAAPLALTDSIMVYDMAKKAAHLFLEAGMAEESAHAAEIAGIMRAAVREHLIDFETMTMAGACQTSQAFAIATGIFEDAELACANKRLLDIIHRDGDVNACGMIGLRYIFHVLSDMGETELAYKIITGKSRTCYGYWIENGATTMWESFRAIDDPGVDSRNHHFLGDISSWFIQNLAGLKPNPNVNDISYFEISPGFVGSLDFARAHFDSKFGRVSSSWKRDGGKILLEILTPDGTHCDVVLPDGYHFADGENRKHFDGEISAVLTIEY